MSETKADVKMTPAKAKALFQKTMKKLHDAGFDVLAVIQAQSPEGDDTTTRILLQGDPTPEQRARKSLDLLAPLHTGALQTVMRHHPPGAVLEIPAPLARVG